MAVSTLVAGVGMAVVSVGISVWWRRDEVPLIVSMIIGYLVPIAMLGGPSVRRLRQGSGLSMSERMDLMRIGLAGIVTAPMFWVLTSMDRWFLGYFADSASVGIYSVGYSIGILGMIVNSAIQSVWVPEVAREYERTGDDARVHLSRIAEWLVSALALVWLAIVAMGGDIVRLLAGPAFQSAAEVIPYIAGGVLFYGIAQLANGALLLKKKLHYAMWWWLAASLVCVVLNVILIPVVGRVGAAITQAVAFAVVAGGIVYGAQMVFPLQFRIARLGCVAAGIGMLGVLMARSWSDSPIQSLLGKIPVGLVVVYLVARLVAPQQLQGIGLRIWHVLSLRRPS
jgi:O-antigen/teichoic acid export membrane protein